MKKRLKWIILGLLSLVLAIPLVCLLVFVSKTMDIEGTYKYSTENTEIQALPFETARHMVHEEGKWVNYVFRVAADGLSGRSELFIFRGVQFGPFQQSMEWDRFRFAYHALGGEGERISSVMFTPRDLRNRKLTTNWMVFYSSNTFYHVSRCIFTVEENGELRTMERFSLTKKAFFAILPDLGKKDGVLRKFVKAEFLDKDGDLVATIDGNTGYRQASEK